MEFKTHHGNYLKSVNTTSKMMKNLIIALLPIILFSFYKNGVLLYLKDKISFGEMFWPLLMIIIPSITGVVSEYLWAILIHKNKITFKELMTEWYAFIPGIFIGLISPINTPISVLIIGSVFASIIGKMIYGGFGHNLFNPALLGRLFISVSYSAVIIKAGNYLNKLEQGIDTIAGATPLTNFSSLKHLGSYHEVVSKFGNLWDFLIGNIPGSLGETSALLCLVGLVYLIIKKVVKWRIPVTYITTVFVMTLIIGFSNNQGLWYPAFQILSGGLMFGAIFMATDPVTSPTTGFGQIIHGVCLGILTVILRFLTNYPEGVLTSILLMNLFVPIINKVSINNRFSFKKMAINIIVLLIIMMGISFTIGVKIKETKKPTENETVDKSFKVIDRTQNNNQIIYTVSQKGHGGFDSIKAKITFDNNVITTIEILSTNESYFDIIDSSNYLNDLISNQNDVDKVDAVSGATYTSNYLKQMIKKVIIDYEAKK